MNNIITVSDNAVNQIKKIISSAKDKVDGVIVDIDKSGCSGYSYKLDFAKNADPSKYEVIEKDGIKVFIEPKATMFLIGSEMDYMSDKLSSRFVFNNPNEKSSCGCGESFSV
jgi:iron-sulfur cluster assembly protein